MSFVESVREHFREELKVDPRVVRREEEFGTRTDSSRKDWILKHVILYPGSIEQIKQERPDKIIYFVNYQRHKKVRVDRSYEDPTGFRIGADLESQLKMALFLRGANLGVEYRICRVGSLYAAEAVPAVLTEEM